MTATPNPKKPNPGNRKPAPPDAATPAPRRLHLVPPEHRAGLGGKVIGLTNAGQRGPVGIALADTRHHIHILGPTGTGKTSLLLRMILDDACAGRGVAVFDSSAKADLIRDILDRLPTGCGDRLVIIDPDETQAPPAINLLDPAVGGSAHQRAAHIAAVMAKVWYRWWGHRTADIAHHALLTLALTPGATLAQVPRLLGDTRWRARRVAAVKRRIGAWEGATLAEFWDGYEQLTPGARAGLTAPLLSKLRLVLAQPLAANLLGVPATTFRLDDILDGGILLVRLPRGVIGEDGGRLIGSLLLAALWQAATARAARPEHQRLDATVVLDEAQHVAHLPIGLDDALAEARGLRVSFVLAHQYLAQLTPEMAAAVDANARNKVYFTLAPDDAARLARHVEPRLDAHDLTRLGGYEVVLRPVADGHPIRPVTLDTLPPPPPIAGRGEQLRAAARSVSGLAADQRRRLLATAATSPAAGEAAAAAGGPVEAGDLGSFPSPRAARSQQSSQASSHPSSASHDSPSEFPPRRDASAQVTSDEEDPWTGPDW
jgi:hypothetical protein